MGNDQGHAQTVRVRKRARPWSGFFLGLLLGLAVAVLLQQAGVWPLDRLLLYGSAGVFALIGILMSGAGRERAGAFASVVPLVLAVALIGWGATGIAEVNETGQINGGCAVQAESSVDSTTVTDTSRQDPFQVDPEGSLSWSATSPAPITNHLWEIYVDIGGFPLVVASNDEPEPNTDEDTRTQVRSPTYPPTWPRFRTTPAWSWTACSKSVAASRATVGRATASDSWS